LTASISKNAYLNESENPGGNEKEGGTGSKKKREKFPGVGTREPPDGE